MLLGPLALSYCVELVRLYHAAYGLAEHEPADHRHAELGHAEYGAPEPAPAPSVP